MFWRNVTQAYRVVHFLFLNKISLLGINFSMKSYFNNRCGPYFCVQNLQPSSNKANVLSFLLVLPSIQRLAATSFPYSPLSSDCQTTDSLIMCRDLYASSVVPWDSANCTHSLPTQQNTFVIIVTCKNTNLLVLNMGCFTLR